MQENNAGNKWSHFTEEMIGDTEIDINQQESSQNLPPQDQKTPAEITKLENALDEARLLADSRHNDYLRIMAELDNVRRRSALDEEKARKFAVEKLVRELLPVVDSLEKSLEHAAEDSMKQGVQMTLDLLLAALRKHNVTAIDPIGQIFNPEQSEAISAVPNADCPPNTVIQVLQKAYVLNERLIRPALVVVSTAA